MSEAGGSMTGIGRLGRSLTLWVILSAVAIAAASMVFGLSCAAA